MVKGNLKRKGKSREEMAKKNREAWRTGKPGRTKATTMAAASRAMHAHPQGCREQTLWGGHMDAHRTGVAAVTATDGSGKYPAARARRLCGHQTRGPRGSTEHEARGANEDGTLGDAVTPARRSLGRLFLYVFVVCSEIYHDTSRCYEHFYYV